MRTDHSSIPAVRAHLQVLRVDEEVVDVIAIAQYCLGQGDLAVVKIHRPERTDRQKIKSSLFQPLLFTQYSSTNQVVVKLLYLIVLGASVNPGPLVGPPGDMLAERRQGAVLLRLFLVL